MADEETLRTYYRDGDGDGYGLMAEIATACSAPAGYASVVGDCDDLDPSRNPSAAEGCNDADDDCDGAIDETLLRTYYADGDGDGFGDPASATTTCDPAPGAVGIGTDCDDSNNAANPGAPEVCDLADNDCDGAVDDGVLRTFFLDMDGDGFGRADMTVDACAAPAGYATSSRDCDDSRGASNPGAPEICDGFDNNCDGRVDEGALRTFYRDADADSFGTLSIIMQGCTTPTGYSDRHGDCDDTRASVNPAAAEVCDARDNDCNGATDTGCSCVDTTTRPCGSDVGACVAGIERCTGGMWGTCSAVGPTAESCNMADDDCDGMTDEGVQTSCWADPDRDSYAVVGATMTLRCGPCMVTETSRDPATGADCREMNATVYPGAPELCDRIDNNCSSGGGTVSAEDADNDMHAPVTTTACAGGFPRDDCHDGDPDVFAGQPRFFPHPRCTDGWPTCVCGDGSRRCQMPGSIPAFCGTLCGSMGAGSTYDYDCSGFEQRPPNVGTCAPASTVCGPFTSCGTDGHQYLAGAACGSSATLQDCGCAASRCTRATSTVRLPCR
jgi:hypothetical protein